MACPIIRAICNDERKSDLWYQAAVRSSGVISEDGRIKSIISCWSPNRTTRGLLLLLPPDDDTDDEDVRERFLLTTQSSVDVVSGIAAPALLLDNLRFLGGREGDGG